MGGLFIFLLLSGGKHGGKTVEKAACALFGNVVRFR